MHMLMQWKYILVELPDMHKDKVKHNNVKEASKINVQG